MNNRLAIVIPAYKETFFNETLQSISKQTCKKFTLYIGDDASPNNIYEIVKKFENEIDIIYKRFDENLGGKDLVAHWNRCVDMSVGEEWIWLFSDDDFMAANCVELFYKHIESDHQSQLLHFNADIIDGAGNKYASAKPFPSSMTSSDYFESRMRGKIFSFIVEYIFTRKLYIENDKFQKFDLAWCADDATWLKFSRNTGITTIDKRSLVFWRFSGENISSLNVDLAILYRKLNAKVAYLEWSTGFFKKTNTSINITHIIKVKWILSDVNEASYLAFSKRIAIAYKYAKVTGTFINGFLGVLYVSYYESKHWIVKKI
nr:glycosyltransferase [uncultured Flavobacterium sp.]